MGQPIYLKTDDKLFDKLGVWLGTGETHRKVLFSIPVPAKAGDLLHVEARCELTNDLGYNVGVTSFIVLGDLPTTRARIDGQMVVYACGENVTKNMHHLVVDPSGYYKFEEDFEGYVNLVLEAYSSAASGSVYLKVDGYGLPGTYGKMEAVIFPAPTAA